MMMRIATPSTRGRLLWWLVFAAGLGVSLLMALRSQLGGDQYLLLDLGWRLLARGEWLPYGMPTSAGGRSPGGLMSLIIALPLYLWRDYRAPALMTAALHAGAFLLLAQALKPALTVNGRWLLLLLVWCNPWRIYFSAHLWNANFMFVAAVLHLATAQRMAKHRGVWATGSHVVLIALAMQVHTSAAVLAILSLLLVWKRMIQVHWGGFALGVAIGVAAYVPWLLTVTDDPNLMPGNKGFFLRGLLTVFPLLRGVMYWLKMSSLSMASRMLDFDFTPTFGADANVFLAPVAVAAGILAHLTLAPSIWAHWRFVRNTWRWQRWWHGSVRSAAHPRAWLRVYVALTFASALLSYAISPTTVMFWQAFIALPASTLVLVTATQALLLTRAKRRVLRTATVWSVLTAILLACMALAAPLYRCGGRSLPSLDAMLIDLDVPAACIRRSPR